MLAVGALVEFIMWLLLRGTGVIVGALVLILGTVAAFGISRSTFDAPRYGGSHRKKGRFDE
jgi:hypothetical protein